MRRTALMILGALAAQYAMAGIDWIAKVHDFGAFNEDTKAKTAYFSFVNNTDEPVTIISANATCGCTTPKYPKAPVAPGDTAVIEVTYDPTGRPGRFEKQVYVRTSASHERERLVIKGTVIGNPETVKARYPISMGDLKLSNGAAMMGRVLNGRGKMQYVYGYNASTDTIRPQVTKVPDFLGVDIEPAAIAPGAEAVVDVYFRADRCSQWGMVSDSVMIAPNPGAQDYALPVVAFVEEDFSGMTPEQLDKAPKIQIPDERLVFDPIPLGSTKKVTTKFKIVNRGASPLLIRRVYTADLGFDISVKSAEVAPGKSTDVTVEYDPSVQPEGIVNAKLNIIANDPANPTSTLRVVAERR